MDSVLFCPVVQTCLPRAATVVWNVTRHARHRLHEVVGAGSCRGPAPFGPKDRAARRPRQTCENVGCVDLFMDVLLSAHSALHVRFRPQDGDLPDAAFAYLTTAVRSQLAELNRQARVARGGVAKPQRRDGTVGRIASVYKDRWLLDVFRFLLGYVASLGGTASGWPVDVLTQRKNLWDGGERVVGSTRARAELRADVDQCLAVVRREAGVGWLYECLLLPLANRVNAVIPDCEEQIKPLTADDRSHGLDMAADSMLRDMLGRIRSGTGLGNALRAVVDEWLVGQECPTSWAAKRDNDLLVQRLAKRLVWELNRDEEAA